MGEMGHDDDVKKKKKNQASFGELKSEIHKKGQTWRVIHIVKANKFLNREKSIHLHAIHVDSEDSNHKYIKLRFKLRFSKDSAHKFTFITRLKPSIVM